MLKGWRGNKKAAIQTLIDGVTVPDLGGKATTMQMAEAIAAALKA
jgi:isocitrate/isopropylmalate dehydrogenase